MKIIVIRSKYVDKFESVRVEEEITLEEIAKKKKGTVMEGRYRYIFKDFDEENNTLYLVEDYIPAHY